MSKEESLEYWNKRAETIGACASMSSKKGYMPRFIDMLALEEGQTLFDMGCATGGLAVPLAREGHFVCARDFSNRMIEKLQETVRAESLSIDAAVMAWEDDWEEAGIGRDSFDVAVASRSLPVKSGKVAECLEKLDGVARVKAAVTVSASVPPAFDERLLEHLGREVPSPHNHVEVMAALADMGRYPTVDYIPFERPMRFEDEETAYSELRRLAGRDSFDAREEELFERYAAAHYKVSEADGKTIYQLDYRLEVMWAYIEWATDGSLSA